MWFRALRIERFLFSTIVFKYMNVFYVLVESMFCTNCGIDLEDNANYCTDCGQGTVTISFIDPERVGFGEIFRISLYSNF